MSKAKSDILKTAGILIVAFAAVLIILQPENVEANEDVIKVGMPVSLTGKYDILGKRNLQGARLWSEYVNEQGGIYVRDSGKKIKVEMVWYDDRSDKGTAQKVTEKLVSEDGVDFLFGPYGTTLTSVSAAVAEREKKILFSHSGADDEIWQQGYRYVIGVLSPASRYYDSVMNMIAGLDPKIKTAAIVVQDDPFTLSIAEKLREHAKEHGIEIVIDEVYPTTPTDLVPVLQKVKAASPDVILGASHFKDGVLFARQVDELNIRPKMIALGSAPVTPEWWETLGEGAANFILGTSQWEPVNAPDPKKFSNWYGPAMTGKEFNDWFSRRWGGPADFRGSLPFASGLILQWGIERAGSLDPERIRTALNDMDIMTFCGRFKIDPETGIQEGHDMMVIQWQNGRKVVVWPQSLAEGQVIYPMP